MNRNNTRSYSTLPPLPTLPMGADNFAPFERLFDSEEAAKYLRVEPRTVCLYITRDSSPKLKASRIGKRWIVTESNLRAFVKANEQDFPESK